MEIQAASAAASQSKSTLSRANLTESFDNFLNLLTTQLQHQDPLSPMDSNEFTNQIVQFAGVEQSIATNTNLEKLISLQQANRTASAVEYLGKRIEANGQTTPLVDGYAEWNYALSEQAKSVDLTITDSSGNKVYGRSGATDIGAHQLIWDGIDDSGNPAPDGNYTLTVTARDEEGKAMKPTTTVVGHVTGIETQGDDLTLFIGQSGIPLSQVIAILDSRPAATVPEI
jgi:flagellar basal-body rod modification protein FlgD